MGKTPIEQIYSEFPPLRKYSEEVARQMYDTMKPKRDLSDISEGDWVSGISVLIYKVLGNNSYIGCPVCFKKQEGMEEGVSFQCTHPKCGTQRIATRLSHWALLAADSTSKVILDFPAFSPIKIDDGDTLLAKEVLVTGRVQKPRERKGKAGEVMETTPVISIKDLKVVSDIRDVNPNGLDATSPSEKPAPIPPTSATPKPMPTAPVAVAAPKVQVPTTTLGTFQLFMGLSTENGNKPIPEAQIKSYVETNLKTPLDAFLPYLETIHTDAQGTLYRLKK